MPIILAVETKLNFAQTNLFPRRTKMRTSQVTPTEFMKLTLITYESQKSHQMKIEKAC